MGSDDGKKSKHFIKPWMVKRCSLLIAVSTSVFIMLHHLNRILPPPELVQFSTFTADERMQRLPPQCKDVARKFYRCQSTYTQTSVLACHRKWCNSPGHCEPCGGIGDRTRCMLSQVQDAAEACRRVQLDYPLTDVSILDSALYIDPAGWWAELFRYRSYHVSDRKAVGWDKTSDAKIQYSHFTAHGITIRNYDPCYFHALFQPAPNLQEDIDRHNAALGNRSIAIHFRTGDAVSFGVGNNDTRVTNLHHGWEKMYKCATDLAVRLYGSEEGVTYFLATDNPDLKSMVQKEKEVYDRVYTTEPRPNSYLRGLSGDRDAWMELYLLSSRQGLVVNVLPKGYGGPAGRTSFFSALAMRIGFMSKEQVMECHPEEP